MRCARLLAAVSGLVLTASVLTACQTHVGSAAFVGSQRISESQLNDYLTTQAQTYKVTNSDGSTTTTNPKSEVLTVLIRDRLFTALFRELPGGEPSAGAIAAARQEYLTETQQTVAAITQSASAVGFKVAFTDLELDSEAEIIILLSEVKDPGDGTVLIARAEKLGLPVDVSPRFGTWQFSSLGVLDGPAQPSFLKLPEESDSSDATAGTSS